MADLTGHSESDSVRDECSSGMRSEGEDDAPARRVGALSWEDERRVGAAHGSCSTLSSCSTTSQAAAARLIQSSLRESVAAPVPPPRTSSTAAAEPPPPTSASSDLGKRSTCMQCYLSGHSDGSVDSAEQPSTEGSSSAGGTPRGGGGGTETGSGGGRGGGMTRDGDSGIGPEAIRPYSDPASAGLRQSESRDSGLGAKDGEVVLRPPPEAEAEDIPGPAEPNTEE